MRFRPPCVLAALSLALATPASAGSGLDVRLNEVQVIGSHNSYHVQPLPELIDIYVNFDPNAIYWEYTHRPLDEQFELLGIRQIELDIFVDDLLGGRYAEPFGLTLIPPNEVVHLPEMDPPGLKVIHVPDLDFVSTCPLFVDCLQILKDWSDGHPGHLPILVLVELKDDPPPIEILVQPLPFDAAALDAIDAEIRSVFPEEQILTPDDVRGSRATLPEAIKKDGWPTLREARGKVLFAMDNGGAKVDLYVAGHPALAGRVLFTDSEPGSPEAAFAKRNDPIGQFEEIEELVRKGFIVRTRADADTVEARTGDTEPRDAALASGAQYVSTDYPELGPFGTDYIVDLPGDEVGRCNPVNGPKKCRDDVLENLDGAGVPIAGKSLRVQDRQGDPTGRRITLQGADVAIETPLPGTADDPSVAGATFEIGNLATAETVVFELPPGAAWKGLGKPAGSLGWVYKDAAGASGPCTSVTVKNGASLTVKCTGKRGNIPFSLDEASQGQLDATFRFGGGPLHCLRFGGSVLRDTSVGLAKKAEFFAKNAPATACPN
jgi:hypothetical protein